MTWHTIHKWPVHDHWCTKKIARALLLIAQMFHPLRGRSQLSTFMKAYTAYARGEGVWDHRTLFPRKSTFIFNYWQCIIKYCTCLECGQYAHICRSFMYNNTFETLFQRQHVPKGAFFGRKQWRHISVSVRPHRGATEFSPLELIPVHNIARNCEYFTNHLMQYVLQYDFEKNQHFRVRFWGGGRGSSKSVLCVRFHKCR